MQRFEQINFNVISEGQIRRDLPPIQFCKQDQMR